MNVMGFKDPLVTFPMFLSRTANLRTFFNVAEFTVEGDVCTKVIILTRALNETFGTQSIIIRSGGPGVAS